MAGVQRASGAAAEHRRRVLPRRRSAGGGGLGATEGLLVGGLAVEHLRGVRNALVATGRWLGAQTGFLDGEGGSAATEFAGTRCLGA